MKIPKVNEIYDCFDDGKIRESRLYKVEIKDVIPFDDIDKDILTFWKKEVKSNYWLFSKETDYFIKAINKDNEEEIFVRCKVNGWFSIGFRWLCGSRLDIDGELIKHLNSEI